MKKLLKAEFRRFRPSRLTPVNWRQCGTEYRNIKKYFGALSCK